MARKLGNRTATTSKNKSNLTEYLTLQATSLNLYADVLITFIWPIHNIHHSGGHFCVPVILKNNQCWLQLLAFMFDINKTGYRQIL